MTSLFNTIFIMRINKYLALAGVCSRREADRLIDEGKVTVNGNIPTPGTQVEEGDVVEVYGKKIQKSLVNEDRVVLVYNKPPGLICSTNNIDGETIFDHIDYPKRLFYAGRLDKYSRGLLILTNDGKLADSLMRGRNAHEREYIVTLDKAVSDESIKALRKGVFLKELNTKTRPCKVSRVDDKIISITLTQGLNRQVRRMCESEGYRVLDLCRVRIANIELGRLKEGTLRKLTKEEKESLLCQLEFKMTFR